MGIMKQSNSPSVSLGSDLAAMPLFGSLDLEIVQALATGAEQMALPPGEWLFRQGQASGALFVV
jgi:CRP-like cAMP-binding protein